MHAGEITTTSNPNIPMQAGSWLQVHITSTSQVNVSNCDIINLPELDLYWWQNKVLV